MTDEARVSGEITWRADQNGMDPELSAINTLMEVLSNLKADARTRVVSYVFGRLGVNPEQVIRSEASLMPKALANSMAIDIRSFANDKKPLTAIDRAAVVAFYLSEVSPEFERQRSIGQEEIVRYFKQAGFPLPASPSMALVHAKNAGFFELDGPGQYRLNAVGYNLVAHRMPKEGSDRSLPRRISSSSQRSKPKSKQKALPEPKTSVRRSAIK